MWMHQVSDRGFFYMFGIILVLPVGWTRCFHMLQVGPPLNQSFLSWGQTDRPLWSSTSLFVILTSMGHVPDFPWSHPKFGTGRWGGDLFPLSNYLASLSHAQCKNLPLSPSWPVGEDHSAPTDCFTVTTIPQAPQLTNVTKLSQALESSERWNYFQSYCSTRYGDSIVFNSLGVGKLLLHRIFNCQEQYIFLDSTYK